MGEPGGDPPALPRVEVVRAEATPGAIPTEVPQWPGPYQFVTGPAGSGKTTLVRGWATHDPGFLLCATTGIAAVNLGDAVTVHSTLRYSTTEVLETMFQDGWLQARMRKLRASGVTRYGIDEVSMLPARVLTILTYAIDELNSEAAVQMGHEPTIGITLVGDFLQLPPVKEEYAFESPEWAKYEVHTRRLDGTHRQHDEDFITALRAVRVGNPRVALDILRPYIVPTIDRAFPGVTILGKNAQVDRANKMQFGELKGEVVRFPSRITGRPEHHLSEWAKEIPIAVELKVGARVMILANKYDSFPGSDHRELVYANGDCGFFVDGNPGAKTARVQLQRTGQVVTVTYNVRQHLKPTGAKGKKKDRYEVLAEIDYMPLRLAYASSVHKSQGLTLDLAQVDISDHFFTQPAMTYVALTRARSLEGLRIVGNPDLLLARCTVDPKVSRWR